MRDWPIIAEKQLKSKQVVRRLIRSFNIPPPPRQPILRALLSKIGSFKFPLHPPPAKIAFRCLTHNWTILSVINSECYGHVCENCPSKLFAHKGRLFNFKPLHENTCITPERLDTSSSNAPPHLGKVHLPPRAQTTVKCPWGNFQGVCWSFEKAISELPLASFSKRGLVLNHCYENEFNLHVGENL